jgi:hypothetical protein
MSLGKRACKASINYFLTEGSLLTQYLNVISFSWTTWSIQKLLQHFQSNRKLPRWPTEFLRRWCSRVETGTAFSCTTMKTDSKTFDELLLTWVRKMWSHFQDRLKFDKFQVVLVRDAKSHKPLEVARWWGRWSPKILYHWWSYLGHSQTGCFKKLIAFLSV